MSSASFYDWEKSLQNDPSSQFIISPSSLKKKQKSNSEKPKGTIDYFIERNTKSEPEQIAENPLEELNDIGDLIFRKIVKLWKMKNLE